MKISNIKTLKKAISLGLAVSLWSGGVLIVNEFNQVYGASETESSFSEVSEGEKSVKRIDNTQFLGASESGYVGKEAEERKKEDMRRAINDGGRIDIYTAQQYVFLVNEMNKVRNESIDKMWTPFQNVVISLQADIDLKGEECPTIDSFAGKFYGNDMTIKNLKLNQGLINDLQGRGEVRDLRVEDIEMTLIEGVEGCKRGVIVHTMYNALIENITVSRANINVIGDMKDEFGVVVGAFFTSDARMKNIKVCDVKIEVGGNVHCLGKIGLIVGIGMCQGVLFMDSIVVEGVDIEVKGYVEDCVGGLIGYMNDKFVPRDVTSVTIDRVKIKVLGKMRKRLFFWYRKKTRYISILRRSNKDIKFNY